MSNSKFSGGRDGKRGRVIRNLHREGKDWKNLVWENLKYSLLEEAKQRQATT